MMERLAYVPSLMKTEALPNYLSRLAAINGAASLEEFRWHFALPTNLSYASADLFEKVGGLTGIPQPILESSILFAVTGHGELGHNKLRWANLHTASARYCPLCVLNDSLGNHDRDARSWARGAWHASSNYVCVEHSTPIFTSPIPYAASNRWDFSKHIRENRREVENVAATITQLLVRGYDTYFNDRLRGRHPEVRFLDDVPYHIAYRLCAVVGQMKLFGASENSDWTSSRMHEACCSGFDILSDEKALSNFLNEQHDRHFTRKKSSSRYRVYGPFQRFLTYLCDEPGARPLIDFVRQHAINALPIGPDDDFIGGGGVRRWHTIRTAKLEFNMDTRLVRKMLVERGVLSESQAKLRDNDILIPAREIESLAGARDDGVYLGYVKEKFGIVEATARQLMNLGVIEPLFGAVSGMKTKFSQTAIDATLAAAISGLPERDDDGELVPLVDATRLGARSVANLFAAVVAGRLKARAVSTQSSRAGIMRLLFDPVEVRKEFIKKVGVKRHEFTAIFKFRPLEGDQFFYSDFFERTRERSPTNHREFDVITRTSLEKFQREHLSLAAIAKGRGRPVDMKRLLDQAIILPVWQIEGRRALTFYRRSDIKEFLESQG